MEKDRNEIRKELEEIAPFLSRMQGKGDGLQVPPGYFRQMQREVLQKVREEKLKDQRIQALGLQYWWERLGQYFAAPQLRLAMAAFLLLIAAAVWYWSAKQPAAVPMAQLEEVSAAEMEQYLSNNVDEIELELLLDVAVNEHELGLFPDTGISDEEFNSYMEEIIDDIDLKTLEDLL